MKKMLVACLLLFFLTTEGQNTKFHVIQYLPAPGQHINQELTGTPQAAQNMPVSPDNLISLGGFGGYVILGFEKPIENDPLNPYGVDFTIFGNSFSGSSEPGVVYVSTDKNGNGEPDDTWFEIAGSRHFHSKTIKNYGITYFRAENRNVAWKDNTGQSGVIEANTFHLQEYYPEAKWFPEYPSDSVVFSGTRLYAGVDYSDPGEIRLDAPMFGYADVHPKKQGIPLYLPDNPYTSITEGAGGDPFDISWAIDESGNYVTLDSVHFIKISTAWFEQLGRIGEASTDISWVEDVAPGEIHPDKEYSLELFPLPQKVISGDSLTAEACYFENGKKRETAFTFVSDNGSVMEKGAEGLFYARDPGRATIRVFAEGKEAAAVVRVVIPDSIGISTDFSSVYPGDTVLLDIKVFDNEGGIISLPASPVSLSPEKGRILYSGINYFFIAENPGNVTLRLRVEGYETEKTVVFHVLSEDDLVPLHFTMKSESGNLFPWQKIRIAKVDVNDHVENRRKEHQGNGRHNLAHALVYGMDDANATFLFRDDESASGRLYLYKVGKNDEFLYGWGGKTEPQAFARGWIARLNGESHISGFDTIPVTAGDSIILYHVSDLNSPWNLTRLLTDRDSAFAGDRVTITFEQKQCVFNNGIISETPFMPVPDYGINAGAEVYTGDDGKAGFTFGQQQPLIITAGNDALVVFPRIITTVEWKNHENVTIGPNPSTGMICIRGLKQGVSEMVLLDANGRTIKKFNPHAAGDIVADISDLVPGMYFFRILENNSIKTYKVVKK